MDKLISQLTAGGLNVQDVDEIESQINGQLEGKRFTGLQMRGVEKLERETQDNTIEAACGLNTNGTWQQLLNAWYLRPADFVAGITDRGGASGVLTENIENALRILDYRTYASGANFTQAGISSDTSFIDAVLAGMMLEYVIFQETGGQNVTLDLGYSPGGNEIFINQEISANSILSIRTEWVFSFAAATTLYLNDDDAGSSWNGGTVTIYLVFKNVL